MTTTRPPLRATAVDGPSARSTDSRAAAALSVVAGLATTVIVYFALLHLQAEGRSAAAVNMPELTDTTTYWAFPVLQATGIVGLVLAWVSMVLGLRQASRPARWFPMRYRTIDRVHRYLSQLTVGLVAVHVIATVLDAMDNTWKTVLVPGWIGHQGGPGQWPEAVWGFNSGIFAIYLLALAAPTFYVRRGLGLGRWRVLHRTVIAFYVLSVWHTLILGLDVQHYAWTRSAIWLAQVPLLALVIDRVRRPLRSGARAADLTARAAIRWATIGVCAGAILAILAIVVSGKSGFIHTV